MSKHLVKQELISPVEIQCVDLFCGAGGLTYGLIQAGIDVKAGFDIDPLCRFPYEQNTNARFIEQSVENLSGTDIIQHFNNARYTLLAGCAPCQTFSKYNQKASSKDSRWWLLDQFARLVGETMPTFITMENVPGLAERSVFKNFLQTLDSLNYRVTFRFVQCEEYGIPQQRTRLVLIASKLGTVRLLSSYEFGGQTKTVRQAIGELPRLAAGQADINDPLHWCAKLSNRNLHRIKVSKPGGTWRDWPEDLICECHKRETGKTYPGVYGRMSWDKPSPTITTQFFGFGNGRFGHPEADRALSLREGAILQSFPSSYKFFDSRDTVPFGAIGRLIGNAVPVVLGEVIGKSFIKHIKEVNHREHRKLLARYFRKNRCGKKYGRKRNSRETTPNRLLYH